MAKLDLVYVGVGALWLVVGMLLGIVMGAAESFTYAPLHAHINLVGFACHSIFGLAYRLWPAMKASALAPIQFWLFVLATPVMLIGLYFTLSGGTSVPTIIGSIGVSLGAAFSPSLSGGRGRNEPLSRRERGRGEGTDAGEQSAAYMLARPALEPCPGNGP